MRLLRRIHSFSATAVAHDFILSSSQIRFSHNSLPPEYGMESLGEFQSDWLNPLHPHRIRTTLLPQLETRAFLPSFRDWMNAPAYEAIIEFATTRPYHDVLQLIMEHSFFFLIQEVGVVITGAEDAPLPHVIYEDVMKVMTFSSIQNVPEEQFQLSASFRFSLLSSVAITCLHDRGYLFQAQCLFRKMEQQQSLTAQDYALMVWICAAARDWKGSMQMLLWMHEQGFPFCPKVFSLLQHPFVDIRLVQSGQQPHVVKGLLVQERLARAWAEEEPVVAHPKSSTLMDLNLGFESDGKINTSSSRPPLHRHKNAFAIGVHAVLVHYCLTRQHYLKWEWIDRALQQEEEHPSMCELSQRTVRLALDLFTVEQGRYCSTSVVKRLFMALLRRADHFSLRSAPMRGTASAYPNGGGSATVITEEEVSLPGALLFLLMRVRRNEIAYLSGTAFPKPAAAPRFTDEEIEYTRVVLRKQAVNAAHSARTSAKYPLPEDPMVIGEAEDIHQKEAFLYDQRFELAEPLVLGLMTKQSFAHGNESDVNKETFSPSSRSSKLGELPLDDTVVSSTVAENAADPADICSWKALLQQCASFGRQLCGQHSDLSPNSGNRTISPCNRPEGKNVLLGSSHTVSLTDKDIGAVVKNTAKGRPDLVSAQPSIVYARVLFQELQRLDAKGVVHHRDSIVDEKKAQEDQDLSPTASNTSSVELALEIEKIQKALHKAGSSASQKYFSWQHLQEKREEDHLRHRLAKDPTSVWTSI